MGKSYRIHPAIGVARLGSSPDGWYLGPETPGQQPRLGDDNFGSPADGLFKTGKGKIKRQAVRFRIYEYDDSSGTPVATREVTSQDAEIHWKVTVANRKSAAKKFSGNGDRNEGLDREGLIISAQGELNSSAPSHVDLQGSYQGANNTHTAVLLGDMELDRIGRLLFRGGFGVSNSPSGEDIVSSFDNEDWYDDTCDGDISASITFHETAEEKTADSAWVLVGPPNFAPPIGNIVTLWDIVYDVAKAKWQTHYDPELANGNISFLRHIFPILQRTSLLHYVEDFDSNMHWFHGPGGRHDFLNPVYIKLLSDNARSGESFDAREIIFDTIRDPSGIGAMPRLNSESNPQRKPRVADWHYEVMLKWMQGDFVSDWDEAIDPTIGPIPLPLEGLAVKEQPFALDKAALESCVGASLHPGIEASKILREDQNIYRAPFRIKATPGQITESLSVPWQADFAACDSGWWPAQRPNDVFRKDSNARRKWYSNSESIVEMWKYLGFVTYSNSPKHQRLVEKERDIND